MRQWGVRGGKFSPFLCSVVTRLALDHRRDAARAPPPCAATAGEAGCALAAVPDPDLGPEERLLRCEQADAVHPAVARLPARDRELLLRRHVHGESYKERAAALHLHPGQTGIALHRAKARLGATLSSAHPGLFPPAAGAQTEGR